MKEFQFPPKGAVKPFPPPAPPRPLQPGEQIQIDLKNAVPKVCHCGCGHFIPAVSLYKVSALVSPTGQELMAQQPVMVCLRCQTPLESLTN